MKRELARAIVGSMRCSGEAGDTRDLREFGLGDWQQTFQWLDDSGLALYFLRHLHSTAATGLLPPQVLARLEKSFAENRLRWKRLGEDFAAINERFQRAGVRFAVVKGLALVPEYCPDELLRAPSDLDYLMDEKSLALAGRVLEAAGYRFQGSSDIEFKFCKPASRMPLITDSPYSMNTEPLVELHLGFWKRANGVPLQEPLVSLENTIPHSWQGLSFPVLNEQDTFFLQIIHVFQHILECWVKLCWLLEIGFFLSKRSCDSAFWREIDKRIQVVPRLADFAAIVIGLAKIVFASPTPVQWENWMHSLRPASRLWLRDYASAWALGDNPISRSSFFSTAKLALFLHQEYVPDEKTRRGVIRHRLFPWKRPQRIAFPMEHNAESFAAARRLQWRFTLDRILFHSGSSLRYLWEVPRYKARQLLASSSD